MRTGANLTGVVGVAQVQELEEKARDPSVRWITQIACCGAGPSHSRPRHPQCPEGIEWHFIGHLQSNKAQTMAGIRNLALIETVSSVKLATALEKVGTLGHAWARAPPPPPNWACTWK
jgi:hypothetical protein